MRDSPSSSYLRTAFLAELPRCLAAIALFALTLFTGGAAPALETPRFIQAQNIGNGTVLCMATTPGDGFVVVGAFSGIGNFGPSNVTAGDSLDVFVACYGVQSNLLWLNTAGGNQLPRPSWSRPDEANAVALDSSGNMFVAGYIGSPALFGVTSISGSAFSGESSLFLAKYDSSGALLWVRSSESTGSQVAGAYQVCESLEFKLKRQEGGEVVLVIPPEVLEAREAIQLGEEQRILASMFDGLEIGRNKLERSKAVLEKRRWKFNDVVYAPLLLRAQAGQLREQHLNIKVDGRDLEELIEEWNQRQSDPKLREGVLKLAQDGSGVIFEREHHALVETAVTPALWAKDDAFFLRLGRAFERARKARKARINGKSKSLSRLPLLPEPSPREKFLVDWWLTEDGLGPQLCLFTDQALGELLEVVFRGVRSEDWRSYASKTRQRMRLRSAKRKVVVEVRLEALTTMSRRSIQQGKTRFDGSRFVLVAAG